MVEVWVVYGIQSPFIIVAWMNAQVGFDHRLFYLDDCLVIIVEHRTFQILFAYSHSHNCGRCFNYWCVRLNGQFISIKIILQINFSSIYSNDELMNVEPLQWFEWVWVEFQQMITPLYWYIASWCTKSLRHSYLFHRWTFDCKSYFSISV